MMSLRLNKLFHTHLYTSGYKLVLASASQFFRKFSSLSSWQTWWRYKDYFTGENHKRILIEKLSYANPNLTINVSRVKNQTSKRVCLDYRQVWQNHNWQKLSLELQQNRIITMILSNLPPFPTSNKSFSENKSQQTHQTHHNHKQRHSTN